MRIERVDWDGRDAGALAGRVRSLVSPPGEVAEDVAEIVDRVHSDGDAGLRDVSERLGDELPEKLRVDPEQIAAAPALLEPGVRDALRAAAQNIGTVARAELAANRPASAELDDGQQVEVRDEPVTAAGVYVPGGRAPYPASALMCAVPARVAGVSRIAVATPPRAGGRPDETVLAACATVGVDEVYAVGGAQAIAALAYGTESIRPVDVVAGPGNRYVTEAKRQVAGQVAIDGIAGPSELVVVADGTVRPDWLALDVCAQAEHGDDGLLAVISPNEVLLDDLAERVDALSREHSSVADAPLALVSAPGLGRALELADEIAPEHLELAFDDADETSARARVAGCVFVGVSSATAFGDYVAGSNHVLPTGGAARFGGPLGPRAFMRRMSIVNVPLSAAWSLAGHVKALADAEGFPVHAESAVARTRDNE
jgi:histidinol dehydrogenase